MVIVISNTHKINAEPAIVNHLFEEGLEVFHLRKSHFSYNETKSYIQNIRQEHHSKIALHHHHGLVDELSLKRIHHTSNSRKELSQEDLNTQYNSKKRISTSVHSLSELESLSPCFEYCFFGPVFNSISKKGYLSIIDWEKFHLPEKERSRVVALGGIDETNMVMVKELGFESIALLGAIWHNNDPIKTFIRIREKW